MAEIKVGFIKDSDIIYDYDRREYFFYIPGYGRRWLGCDLDFNINLIYDRVYKELYFSQDCNVIYSDFFYRPASISDKYSYVIKGFFQ